MLMNALLHLLVLMSPPPNPPALLPRTIVLPGAEGALGLDYLACDRLTGRVWVPAAGTGSVDVIAPKTLAVTRVQGFRTATRTLKGHEFVLGPTAVALGRESAYIGNRGDSRICAVNLRTFEKGPCFAFGTGPDDLASSPDGIVYVAPTKELWVTQGAPPLDVLPPDLSIVVLDASKPELLAKTRIPLEGAAEGYAVDEKHGLFYTNLEDRNRTVGIDVKTHQVASNWDAGCGEKGPRGIAVDQARGLVFVACTDQVRVLDASKSGALLDSFAAGAGVDNIDYVEERQELFVAAGQAATLTILHVGQSGKLETVACGSTALGARVVIADARGTAYVADPRGGRILVFERPR